MVVLNIPFTAYTTTDYDDKRHSLTVLLYPIFYKLFYKQKFNAEIGKDSFAQYDQINFYLILIEHLISFAIAWQEFDIEDRNRERWDELVEEYKLDCIREQLNCRFGSSKIMDNMLKEIQGNFTLQEGIGFWIIEDTFEVQ